MGVEQAAKTLAQIKMASKEKAGEKLTARQAAEIREEIEHDYEFRSSAYYATSQLWDDGIIDPTQTRDILALLLQQAAHAFLGIFSGSS